MRCKIKGVLFEITFPFAAFIAFVLSFRAPSNVLIAIFSSLFHESWHLAAMLAVGNPPECVRLELTGMNIKRMQSVRISIKNELLIALCGPLANVFVFIICIIALCFYENELILSAACINFILMTFNLLPIKRLDGGMALYFLLSRKFDAGFCSLILKITSIFFITVMYAWGIYVFIVSKYNFSVLMIAIFLTASLFGSNEY